MGDTLFVDIHEPEEVIESLRKSVQVTVINLNGQGFADYYWADITGKRRQIERKQIGEALSDLDGLEEQLKGQLQTCDELALYVQGVWTPFGDGIQVWTRTRDGRFFRPDHIRERVLLRWSGFKASLRLYGVDVIEIPDQDCLVVEIIADFKASQKQEHTLFKRYLRPHVPPVDLDPSVNNLNRLDGTGIGPVLSKKLIDTFGGLYGVFTASFDDLADTIGSARASKFWKVIGREK